MAKGAVVAADLIFSLAGGRGRREYALQLWREGYAPAVLLSTARFEIRRFASLGLPVTGDLPAMARPKPPASRCFLAFYDGGTVEPFWFRRQFYGTMSEIVALRDWLREHPQIKSLLVVSSGFHLRRIGLCCRALLPPHIAVRLTAVPKADDPCYAPHHWRLRLLEMLKIPVYAAVLRLRRPER